jgi:taurine dioxygenase
MTQNVCRATFPTKVTVVRAAVRPESCGHTEFINCNAAYLSLPEDFRSYLASKTAKYCYLKTRDIKEGDKVEGLTVEQVNKAKDCAVHPLVTTHPETNLPILFANPSHTASINGMDVEESEEVLSRVFRASASPSNMYAHYYLEGDLLLWDNRGKQFIFVADNMCLDMKFAAVQHRATGCPENVPRKLIRTTAQCEIQPRQ